MRELCWFAKGSQVVAWELRRMWGHRKGFLKWGGSRVCLCVDGSDRKRKGWVGAGRLWCSSGE